MSGRDLAGGVAPPAAVREALELLGVRRLLLGIHDAAFPADPEGDLGRGTPYGRAGRDLLAFARSLGFTGVQLGPQGLTSPVNASPYDATQFSRNPLSLDLAGLCADGLLSADTVAAVRRQAADADSGRVDQARAWQTLARVEQEIWTHFRRTAAQGQGGGMAEGFARFQRDEADWLVRDGLYALLCRMYGERGWRDWTGPEAELDRRLWAPLPGEEERAAARRAQLAAVYRDSLSAYACTQFLLDRQHRDLHRFVGGIGLELFGDLQIGFSEADAWFARSFLLPNYVLGAPPSRTNPEGQPWNYPLLDPAQYLDAAGNPGPALRYLVRRVERMLGDYDGLRIDHPHGLICPWVYRADQEDPLTAVQQGARLFAAPDLADHPDLARYAIVRPDQLDRTRPRYDDHWVRSLDPDQVRRYGLLLAAIMDAARKQGRDVSGIACEILSTQPYPIQRVLAEHGLGRFRITQKGNLADPADVYRGENGRPEDWIMLGNHDTPPIWRLADGWQTEGAARVQADYLATRLVPDPAERDAWAARTAADAGALVQARAADLFVGPAGNVMLFFTDLLGMRELYNRPGVVSPDNWSLRVPADYRRLYHERLGRNRAINLPLALAAALRARGLDAHRPDLVKELDRLAG